jgi:hypothetical protein
MGLDLHGVSGTGPWKGERYSWRRFSTAFVRGWTFQTDSTRRFELRQNKPQPQQLLHGRSGDARCFCDVIDQGGGLGNGVACLRCGLESGIQARINAAFPVATKNQERCDKSILAWNSAGSLLDFFAHLK